MNNVIYLSKDVIEIVICLENDKFRINTNEIKHFQNGTKFISKTKISVEKFYEFVNYLCSISNQWNDFYVRSIATESRWSVLIKTNNNGTKRYSGIDYYPNNWQDFYNKFVSFIRDDNITLNTNESQNNSKTTCLERINLEFSNNGITQKLINDITCFVIDIVEEYKQDRFWSDSARSFLGLLIISNLTNGNNIKIEKLLEQINDINSLKKIILNNITKFINNEKLRLFISNVDIINSDKPLKSVLQLIEEGLKKRLGNDRIEFQTDDIKELMKLVNIGNKDAMKELAYKYEHGDGIEKNIEKAYKIYNELANNYNDFQSKLNICYMYYFGNDYIKQDFHVAFKKFNEIKNQDINGDILYYLGYMFDNGLGINKDEEIAFEYYKKSAKKGFTFAEYSLGQAFLQGRGIKANDAEAIYWLTKATEKEDYMAQYVLGSLYYEGTENGINVINNKQIGLELIKKSAMQGYNKAIDKLKEIEKQKMLEDVDNEYNVEQYLSFTNFDKLNIIDDETEDYDFVCGIRIESNYIGGTVEQLNLYDVGKGAILNFNGKTEIKEITKDEIVLRTSNNIELSKIQYKLIDEKDKIEFVLKVNEFITGWSKMTIPSRVQYKIKVLYVRKKKKR